MSLTQQFTDIATHMVSTLGYGGIAAGLVVDSAGVPIPSEVIIPLAGALAHEGRFNIILVIIIATVAQSIGAILSYWIGSGAGLPLVKRYGKYVLFSERELNKTHRLFERFGAWLTLFGRCIPGIRTYIGYPAGIARMNFSVFVLASVAGSFIWSALLAILGYQLANHLDSIDHIFQRFGLIVVILAAGLFIWYLKHVRGAKSHPNEANPK